MCRCRWHKAQFGAAITIAKIVIGGIAACDKPTTIALTDTEGRSFSARCHARDCTLETSLVASPSAPKPDHAKASFVLHRASRFFAVCDVWVQGSSHAVGAADCRALVCKSDADCPPAIGMQKGSCVHGLCIEPSARITSEDAVLMCLAGTGVPAGTTKQVERYAMGNVCASPCIVPAVCRQP
ncbi:MAG: hypothetical protein CSA75_04575 [Sorangium cellulosum]|nr:MAG: hypothetical protein CSA75_04575 [Sorangium cellulosum]